MIKFKVESDLKLFKALQKHGKLSHDKLSKKTKLKKTTIQYAYKRLVERNFFKTIITPKLENFPELPLAIISFSDLHPIKLKLLQNSYTNKEETRVFITNGNDVFLILMDSKKEKLAELIFEIMEKAQAKPNNHMLSPIIHKLDLTIPDKILDELYDGIKSRRK